MITIPAGTQFQSRVIDGQRIRCATAYPREDMWQRIEAALRAPDPATRLLLRRAMLPVTLWHSYDGRLDIMTCDAGFVLLEGPPAICLAPIVPQQPFGASLIYKLPAWMCRLLPQRWREAAAAAA